VRFIKSQINQLLLDNNEKELLVAYKGYIRKYKHLLTGKLPDFSNDTRMFIESISDLDLVSLLGVYETLTEDIDEKLEELLVIAMKGAKNADQLNSQFRRALRNWLRELIADSY